MSEAQPEPEPEEMAEELSEAAKLEGSEVGEVWAALASASTAARYGSDAFKAAWANEVREQYRHFKECFRVVKNVRTMEIETTDLEFIGYSQCSER